MSFRQSALRHALIAAAIVAGLTGAGVAHAESHALVLWIGDYGDPRNNLPGIDLDAQNARRMAQAMGVPAGNITEVSNRQLNKQAFGSALAGLTQRVKQGDKVFIYYSGHGYQTPGVGGARCTEAVVTSEPSLFPDFDLQDALTRLGEKASQVVMFNDSCFSGGAATKEQSRSLDDAVPKFYAGSVQGRTAITGNYTCGAPTNKDVGMSRTLEVMAADTRGPNVLYVAASNDTQVSFATRRGSVGTLAWATCLGSAAADSNRSGSITGRELQACAQREVDRMGYKQTITLQGNEDLPLTFTANAGGSGGGSAAVRPEQVLHDLKAGSRRDYQVTLTAGSDSLRVKRDFLDLSLTTNKSGYLYLLQVGSDGKTFNMLFPNKLDTNNQVSVGTHRFPRQHWRVRAGGPEGTSHILAILSPTQKDLSKGMDSVPTFASSEATAASAKTLIVEATGSTSGSGDYGASNVLAIRETN